MRIRMSRLGRPRLGVMVASSLLAMSTVVVLGAASPASAACGTMGGGFTHNAGVASVSFTASKNCTNNDVRVYGTLRDTLCDNRSVRLEIRYSGGTFGNDVVHHSGGCNTSRSFDENAGDTGQYVELCLRAYNSAGQSSTDCESWYF